MPLFSYMQKTTTATPKQNRVSHDEAYLILVLEQLLKLILTFLDSKAKCVHKLVDFFSIEFKLLTCSKTMRTSNGQISLPDQPAHPLFMISAFLL